MENFVDNRKKQNCFSRTSDMVVCTIVNDKDWTGAEIEATAHDS